MKTHLMQGIALGVLLMSCGLLSAQPVGTPPVKLSEVAGKTGAFRLTLALRHPLSSPVEIAGRVKLKPEEIAQDYDLSKQVFDVYVPAQPGADGKYGLMDGMVFAGGHGFAPAAWKPVLDKHPLIWIAPSDAGDNRPPLERIGYALDIAANAPQAWPIDGERLYLSVNVGGVPACMGLYYPDIFPAVISSAWPGWFAPVQTFTPQPQTLKFEMSPAPPAQYLTMAKTHSRFFFVHREIPDLGNRIDIDDTIIRRAYLQCGFRNAKAIKVTRPEMDVWTTYAGTWLDQGIQYLESTKPKPPVSSTTRPSSQPSQKPSMQTPSADDPAARSLSTAKSYIAAKRYDLARSRLQAVIGDYPNTPAAKEAQTLLNDIQGK